MNNIEIQNKAIYSPLQIFFGSLFFGPLSMLYFLWKNFDIMKEPVKAKKVPYYGSIFIIILITCLKLTPPEINQLVPGIVVPFLYALVALQISTSLQMNKEAIIANPNYTLQPPWKVVAYGVILYLPWLAISFYMQNL
jgi:hypothetical protein|tara:strand:- start:2614 stop:3027 length:414 start_codon:yes stop_codon:yes gene_type:complete